MEFVEELRNLKEQLKFNQRIKKTEGFRNIVLAGMGGSGIASMIFQELYSKVPVSVINGYEKLDFLSNETLFIATSYSGNTEETLKATEIASKAGCYIVAIGAGGKLPEYANEIITVPTKALQPRSAIGYQLMPLLLSFGLAEESEIDKAYELLNSLDSDNSEPLSHAKRIVEGDLLPAVYGSYPFKVVAYRWNTQFNENSKVLGIYTNFPELDHNSMAALPLAPNKDKIYFMAFDSDNKYVKKRIELTAKLTNTEFNMIKQKGSTLLERLFYMILYGDYVSYHIGAMRKVDPRDISIQEELKKELEKV